MNEFDNNNASRIIHDLFSILADEDAAKKKPTQVDAQKTTQSDVRKPTPMSFTATGKAPDIKKPLTQDAVNHPSHYTRGKIEVIDFIEDQQFDYNLGNAVKYICRAGFKGDKAEDLRKAIWYLNRELSAMEKGAAK